MSTTMALDGASAVVVAGGKRARVRWWRMVAIVGLLMFACPLVRAGDSTIRFHSSTLDLGRLSPQQKIPLILVFSNTGPALVELTNVARSCSCVAVQQWSRRVGAGSTGRVEVLFYVPEQVGAVSERVTLQGVPGGDDLASLEITGQVWQPIEATPGYVSFSAPSNAPATVRIVNHLDEPVEISDPESSHRNFRAALKPVKAGREYQLIIEPVPPFPHANTFARIRLKTNSDLMRELVVSVFMPAPSPAKKPPASPPKPGAGLEPTTPTGPSPRAREHP
jgi:hypothetical protein